MLKRQPLGNQELARRALGKLRFCASLNFASRTLNGIHLHPTAQSDPLFALMCTSVHLRAPLCGKIKKSELLHKPHITAHGSRLHLLASGCINLHLLAEKKLREMANDRLLEASAAHRAYPNLSEVIRGVGRRIWPPAGTFCTSGMSCISLRKLVESVTVRKTSKRDHLWLS